MATGWGASRREIDVPEVANLRDVCTHLRLVRPVKGTLRVTKQGHRLAGDPGGLWWHLADALPLDTEQFAGHQAGLELLSVLLPVGEHELSVDGLGSTVWLARLRRLDEAYNWQHQVEVLRALPDHLGRTPVVIAGEGACPPEDVGGIWGHEELCQVLAGHPTRAGVDPDRAADLRAWGTARV